MTPRRARIVRAIGNPLVFLACAVFLAGSWHALRRMAIIARPLVVFSGESFYVPSRAPTWSKVAQMAPRMPSHSVVYVFDKERPDGPYNRHDFYDNSMDRWVPFGPDVGEPAILLSLTRSQFVLGPWAPVHRVETCGSIVRYLNVTTDAPALDGTAHDRFLNLIPPESLAMVRPVYRNGGGTNRVHVVDSPIWWGYLWNAASVAALVVGVASIVCTPAWFIGVRAERRARQGACRRCRYPLVTQSGTLAICPECGKGTGAD